MRPSPFSDPAANALGDRVLPAVVQALQRVVPPGIVVEAGSRVADIGVDSLALLEAMMDLEASAGLVVEEDTVRDLSINLVTDSDLTVADLASALVLALERSP